jgi:hypothetical protein
VRNVTEALPTADAREPGQNSLSNVHRLTLLALSLLLGVLCFVYRYLAYRGFTNDHYVHLARARQMLLGDWPIRDFLEPGLPLASGLSAVLQAVFGRSLLPEAILAFGCLSVAAALTCWIIVRLTGSYIIASVMTMLQILILPRSYSFPKILLYPIAVIAINRYARDASTTNVVILAAVTVVSFLMRYDHGLFIAAGCAATIIAVHWTSGRAQVARSVAKYGVVTAIMLSPYLMYVHWATGLPPYVRDVLAFNRVESQRSPVRLPTFTFEPGTAIRFLRREATIYIEWGAGVGDEEREALERRFGLVPDTFVEGRTRRYLISDVARPSIERIVRHPSVEDTGGIDRTSYRVNADRFDDACVVCVAPGPGLFQNAEALFQNAEAWLYYVSWLAVLGGAALGMATSFSVRPVMAALTVMTGLAASTFLRDSLSVRLADIWGLVPILLAAVIVDGQRLFRRRAAGRLLGVAVVGLTAVAVVPIGNVREELSKSGLTAGPARMTERFREVTRELSLPADGGDRRSISAYMAACTTPSDRLLVFAYLPDLLYTTDRGFAAGYATFVLGHHAGLFEQRLGIARWRAQSVPFAIAYELQYPELASSFQLIGDELRRRYEPVYKAEAGDRRGPLVVFAERNRPVEAMYEPLGTPCFRRRDISPPSSLAGS